MDFLFNIYSNTLRQEVLPNEMLGRARSVAAVVSFSVMPPAALLGGAIINVTGNIVLVYAGSGVALLLVATLFAVPIIADAKRLKLGEYARQASHSPDISEPSHAKADLEADAAGEGKAQLV